MIIVAQGDAGAGKTTQLTELAKVFPSSLYVPEIFLDMPVAPDDDFFLRNDLAKSAAIKDERTLYLLDRDFLSTLAYMYAREGKDTDTSRHYHGLYKDYIASNNILLPDIFLHFKLGITASRERQRKTNPQEWFDAGFVKRYDDALEDLVKEFIIDNNRKYIIIDSSFPQKIIQQQLQEIIQRAVND